MGLKALVYSRYLETFGGGERSTLDCAISLVELGFEVTIASTLEVDITLEALYQGFGFGEPRNCSLRCFKSFEEMSNAFCDERYDLFVNHTFNSSEPSPAYESVLRGHNAKGVYLLMFPLEEVDRNHRNLRSYDHILVISEFSLLHSKVRWPVSVGRSKLIPPIQGIPEKRPEFAEKEKIILNVGRFNVRGHNKNQALAIKEFKSLVDSDVIDNSWKFFLVGRLNEGQENLDYLKACRKAAKGYNIEIILDASSDYLESLYRKASLLWQFTGYGLPYGEQPEHCEHLGLVALDCFRYGVLPVMYERSGAGLEVTHGLNGFVFYDTQELEQIMHYLCESYGQDTHIFHFNESLKHQPQFSRESYRASMRDFCVSAFGADLIEAAA